MGATPGTDRDHRADGARVAPWGRAAGVIEVEVEPSHRRQGLATFLLAEALRVLAGHDVAEVEAQIAAEDAAGAGLYTKLGFQPAGRGTVYRKELTVDS